MKQNQKSNQKNSKLIFGSVLILMTIVFIVSCWCITTPQDTTYYELKPHYGMVSESDNYESFNVVFDLNNNSLSITLSDYEHIYTLLSRYERVDNHIDGYIHSYYIDEAHYTTPYPFTCEIAILDNSRIKFRLGYEYLILKAI